MNRSALLRAVLPLFLSASTLTALADDGPTSLKAAYGAESVGPSAASRKLLRFVPETTVSIFCIDSPFRLWRWDDITEATAFETASCFTTMLAQHDAVLSFWARRVNCAVSAVRHIRPPKRDRTRPVVDGPFQSQRCELFLLPQKMLPDLVDRAANWENRTGGNPDVRRTEIVGQKILEVSLAGDKFFVAQLAEDVICVANDAGFLAEVLLLATAKSRPAVLPIERNPIFKSGLSYISPAAKFWGIRRFDGNDPDDPTCIRRAPSFIGIHDPAAVFAALELFDTESTDARFLYASSDSISATKRFPEDLKRGVRVSSICSPIPVRSNRTNPDYVICPMTLDLKSVIVAGMDQPGVLFLAITAVFGQGMVL